MLVQTSQCSPSLYVKSEAYVLQQFHLTDLTSPSSENTNSKQQVVKNINLMQTKIYAVSTPNMNLKGIIQSSRVNTGVQITKLR